MVEEVVDSGRELAVDLAGVGDWRQNPGSAEGLSSSVQETLATALAAISVAA